jgi:hypothetical protein
LSKAKELGLSSLDFVQIYNYGIPFENVCGQLNIQKGISKMMLVEPAKFKGILKLSEKDFKIKADFLTPINQT